MTNILSIIFFFSSRRRHTSWPRDWSSDVCSSDLVVQRGPVEDPNHAHAACRFDEKIQNAVNAGYGGVIVAQHHVGSGAGDRPDSFTCGGGDPRPIPAICIGHRALHLMFNRTPGYTIPYPVGDPGDLEPNPGDLGPKVAAETKFDGWGYIHLFDASTLRELDTYAILEEEDPAFATGFGNLTIHEVTFDPTADLAYLSWYAGGFRVVSFGPGASPRSAGSSTRAATTSGACRSTRPPTASG